MSYDPDLLDKNMFKELSGSTVMHEGYQVLGSNSHGKRGCKRVLKKYFCSSRTKSMDRKSDSLSSSDTANSTRSSASIQTKLNLDDESSVENVGSTTHRTFKISYKNPCKDFFSSKKVDLIYSMTVVENIGGDDVELPDMMKVVRKYTGLRKTKTGGKSKEKMKGQCTHPMFEYDECLVWVFQLN